MLSTTAQQSLKDLPKPAANAHWSLVVGPEGGFTQVEEAAMLHSHFIPLRLGKRTLRTESAALATIAGLQALWGDF